jgi:hypothetical protein
VELRDLIVTPLVIMGVYAIAYIVRLRVTDPVTRIYYFPALTVKIIGALALGFVYQFYYGGGDTFAFHSHGSRHIWEAFMDSPARGLRLLFSDGETGPGLWNISDKIWYYHDQRSFFIIRIAAVLDFLTFSSYSGTAVLFAVISFIGGWMLFLTFYTKFFAIHRWIALGCLFVPSIIFWGSGLLKDTITLAFLGIATYCINKLFIERRTKLVFILLLLFSCYVIYAVKVYILMSFLVAAVVWIFSSYYYRLRSQMLRILTTPFVLGICVLLSYTGLREVVKDNPRYSLERIAETVRVTAYDIRYWTGKDAGSGYSLGELDGSLQSVVRLAPAAVVVSLFRPYLWEVKNPFMLLSALESLIVLIVTVWVLFRVSRSFFKGIASPEIAFCLVFSLVFAFGVGVSSYNFGTLARYKIPLFPYYFSALGMILHRIKMLSADRQPSGDATDQESSAFM